MVCTRNQEVQPELPTSKAKGKAPLKKAASKQQRTNDEAEDQLGGVIECLKKWSDWKMPLFKVMETATVKEEWQVIIFELVREIFWRYQHLSREVWVSMISKGQLDTPGVVWALDYAGYTEKIMQDIQANVSEAHEICARIFLRTPEGIEYRLRKGKHKVSVPDQETLEKVLQLRPHELMAIWAPIVTTAKLGYWNDHKSVSNGRAVLAYMKWSSYFMICQFVGLIKSDQNAEIDINAEARQIVLFSMQDSRQLNYWPDKDEDYPIDPKVWIAHPTHIEYGTGYKDFKNLIARFKYTPGDSLDLIVLDKPLKERPCQRGKRLTPSQHNENSPPLSEMVSGDTLNDKDTSGVANGHHKGRANLSFSKELNSNNDKRVVQIEGVINDSRNMRTNEKENALAVDSDPEDLYSVPPAGLATTPNKIVLPKGGGRSATIESIGKELNVKNGEIGSSFGERGQGRVGLEPSGNVVSIDTAGAGISPFGEGEEEGEGEGVVEEEGQNHDARGGVVELEIVGKAVCGEVNLEQKKVALKDSSTIKGVVVKEEEVTPAPVGIEDSTDEDSVYEGAAGDDSDDGDDSDKEHSDGGTEEDSDDDEGESDTNDLDEYEKGIRKRLNRYGRLPSIPGLSTRLDVSHLSRLQEQEWREVE
ncbi:hypothetical protein L211DRAFT_851116 [Terfezia boudieri ATCC MYA-4762]|uniref:Uncharacterized protein n=1 Tax=Terfezia boudieri ATCC MYA-4762 TaxID=1051890 RepID=A0A3N4LJK9_9PEZI|nr:hypothetical protein L211DRAFT_851116 [Terfezia boudieri ATCC MYA-4762]